MVVIKSLEIYKILLGRRDKRVLSFFRLLLRSYMSQMLPEIFLTL
jgi:hypothetical protein